MLKNYILILDVLIMLFLALTIHFYLSEEVLTHISKSRRGSVRTFIISWHSQFLIASFCLALRHIAARAQKEFEGN